MSPHDTATASKAAHVSHNPLVVALAWIAVGTPLLWGVAQTLKKALALFK